MERPSILPNILLDCERVLVQQRKEWGEILVGFEARNRFDVLDEDGKNFAHAAEESGGLGTMLLRNILGQCRAAKVHLALSEVGSKAVALGDKPFRFYFHRMEAYDGKRKVGAIQRRFSVVNRVFTVEDAKGNERFRIVSPFFRIWTFKVYEGERQVGLISKKWGGILKEAFTDADKFGVSFEDSKLSGDDRLLLLIATFLIDFTCFENNQKR